MNFTPTNHYVGEHGILVKVSDDDGASDSQIFNVTVLNTNDAPVFDMATDQVAYEDVEFTFQLTATDEDQWPHPGKTLQLIQMKRSHFTH